MLELNFQQLIFPIIHRESTTEVSQVFQVDDKELRIVDLVDADELSKKEEQWDSVKTVKIDF